MTRRRRRALFDPHLVRTESRRSYRLAFILFWSILLTFLFQRYVISLGIITDRSMSPTLRDGEHVLVNKYIYRLTRPKRGEVVVLRRAAFETEEYVKRVVGLSGEKIAIRSGVIYINGRRLEEPYAVGETYPDQPPRHLGPREYFVLGDNRLSSEDSRHFGEVRLDQLEGRVTPDRLFEFF